MKIGFINTEIGLPLPGPRLGFQAAVKWINAKLGGIGGHPIEGVYCAAGPDLDTTRQCAEQFANDSSIQVLAGGYIITSSSIYPVLQASHKPILLGADFNEPDWTTPGTAISFYPGSPPSAPSAFLYATDYLHAKKVAVVASNSTAGQSAVAALKQVLKSLDRNVTLNPVFVPDTAVDLTGPLLSSGVQNDDALLLLTVPAGCIAVAKALKQLNITKPVVIENECNDPSVTSVVGQDMIGWSVTYVVKSSQLATGIDPVVDNYKTIFPQYSKDSPDGNGTAQGFSTAISMWEVGNKIGYNNLTSASWLSGMKAFTGPVYLGAPHISCGSSKLFPGICSTGVFVYKITAANGDLGPSLISGVFDPLEVR